MTSWMIVLQFLRDRRGHGVAADNPRLRLPPAHLSLLPGQSMGHTFRVVCFAQHPVQNLICPTRRTRQRISREFN